MQIERRLMNHYRRWNLDLDSEKEFEKFKSRLIEVLDRLFGDYLTKQTDIDVRFREIYDLNKAEEPKVKKSQPIYKEGSLMNMVGATEAISKAFRPVSYTEKGFGDTYVYRSVKDCENIGNLATVIQIFFWTLETRFDEIKHLYPKMLEEVKRISVLTPKASFTVCKRGKQLIVYPSGDLFLDKGIIDCTLAGLEDYPEATKTFEEALRIYLNRQTSQYRNLLDNLRFSLEQLLKNILKNEKSLENQKSYLLPWLRERGLHSQVVNLYEKLLKTYQNYQNNAVKHNEDFSLHEIEFMIYLTGNFMRLLLQLAEQDNKNS
jgi:tetratricopeptide (TPR) repeat protein